MNSPIFRARGLHDPALKVNQLRLERRGSTAEIELYTSSDGPLQIEAPHDRFLAGLHGQTLERADLLRRLELQAQPHEQKASLARKAGLGILAAGAVGAAVALTFAAIPVALAVGAGAVAGWMASRRVERNLAEPALVCRDLKYVLESSFATRNPGRMHTLESYQHVNQASVMGVYIDSTDGLADDHPLRARGQVTSLLEGVQARGAGVEEQDGRVLVGGAHLPTRPRSSPAS